MKVLSKYFKAILYILIFIIAIIIIIVFIPYSPLKNSFNKDLSKLIKNESSTSKTYLPTDFKSLPPILISYYEKIEIIGKKKANYINMKFNSAKMYQNESSNKPLELNMDLYNFTSTPNRLAYMKVKSLFMPFEGYDRYIDIKGSMTGIIFKFIKLFKEEGPFMDRSYFITYLAETMLLPDFILDNSYTFKEVSSNELEVTYNKKGINEKCKFTFSEDGLLKTIYSSNRGRSLGNGKFEEIPWECEILEYKKNNEGILLPSKIKVSYKLKNKDFTYFEGVIDSFIRH